MSAWVSTSRTAYQLLQGHLSHPVRTVSCVRPRASAGSNALQSHRRLHLTPSLSYPRRREFFSSNIPLRQQQSSASHQDEPQGQTRTRRSRNPSAKTSLRRVAVEAQRSRDGQRAEKSNDDSAHQPTQTVTAYCVAERFDISQVAKILRAEDYAIDPLKTGLYPQVVHIQVPYVQRSGIQIESGSNKHSLGDVFIFPSGTVVAWAIPQAMSSHLVTAVLLPAAENPHLSTMETEDLEYLEEPTKENSTIKGDTIVIGTKAAGVTSGDASNSAAKVSLGQTDTVLAKVAFSSGLARSTKLAVLESALENYFESTRSIPVMLSNGSRLPYKRSFILRKTGQLLSIRAQLNLYSELTDSLPDLFWDSRHELGLEGYFDQVGRALDVGIRIKTLNEKMDHAQEIASVLRERLSERHGLVLEWMIIALIAVEVAFEILRLVKEHREERRQKSS